LRTPPKVLPFSQFVKWKMSLNISIGWWKDKASNVIGWTGLWIRMKCIKQFFNGGTKVLGLAWSIGPGRYDGTSTTNSFSCRSVWRLKTKFSTEYRAKIYDIVKGPCCRCRKSGCWRQPVNQAQFSKNFLQELAVVWVLDCVLTFLFWVLSRSCFPYGNYLQSDRWVLDQVRLGASSWKIWF
jgi:hypothetical protein